MTHAAGEPSRDPSELLSALINESERLRSDVVQREERQRREGVEREERQRRVVTMIAAALVVALILISAVVVLLLQSRQRGVDTRELIRANNQTNQQILDCTTVGGACYEAGARRQGEIIRQLLDAQKQIALCRAKTEGDPVINVETCIDDALGRVLGPTPTPNPSPTASPRRSS
jgi:hypothetical protein